MNIISKILFLSPIFYFAYFAYFDYFKGNQAFSSTNILNLTCKIKGNISIRSGKKIYDVPGQKDYENTRIQPEHGERWFCSEKEAIRGGWRKAPR